MFRAACICLALVLPAGCVPLEHIPAEFCCDDFADEWLPENGLPAVEIGRALRVNGPSTFPFYHSVGFDPCPQGLGRLTLTNTSLRDVLWEVSSPSVQLNILPDGGLLPSGGSVAVEVSFNCSSTMDLLSFVEIGIVNRDAFVIVERIPVEGRID